MTSQSFVSKQRGQVLVEFVITAVLVLLPCFMMTALLGKYLEAKQKTEVAARYAAWERTVWRKSAPGWSPVNVVKSDEVIRAEVQTRTLATRQQRVSSDAVQAMSRFEMDPLLNSNHLQQPGYEPLLRSDTSPAGTRYVAVSTHERRTPGVNSAMGRAFSLLSGVPYLNRFDLSSDGTQTASVAVGLHNSRLPLLQKLDLELQRSHTVITDGWNAGGPAHVERRVSGLTPASALGGVSDIISKIPSFGYGPLEILTRLKFGHIDVEQVPDQYLETYR